MKTEITTSSEHRPVNIQLKGWGLITDDGTDVIEYTIAETIELCNFLNQLELGDKSLVAELLEALKCIIEMNRRAAADQYGDADKAESWACVTVARSAINKALDK